MSAQADPAPDGQGAGVALWDGTAEEAANPLLAAWERIGRDLYVASTTRRELCKAFSFAIPDDAALDAIAALGPVVELGAGTGYWAKMLRWRGVDVVAYDRMGSDYDHWFPNGGVDEVLRGDVESVVAHTDRTLLIVWPPYTDPMAADAARLFHEAGGQRLVYVGEGRSGCTADDEFFDLLGHERWSCDDDEPEPLAPLWRMVGSLAIPQWVGIHDEMSIYERRDDGAVER